MKTRYQEARGDSVHVELGIAEAEILCKAIGSMEYAARKSAPVSLAHFRDTLADALSGQFDPLPVDRRGTELPE